MTTIEALRGVKPEQFNYQTELMEAKVRHEQSQEKIAVMIGETLLNEALASHPANEGVMVENQVYKVAA